MVFFEVNLISYIALVFSKTVVDLSGGFADVKGLTFGADDYCPLIWLFYNKGAYKEIDHTHANVLFGSSIKNMNVPLKHCSLEATIFVDMLDTCRN